MSDRPTPRTNEFLTKTNEELQESGKYPDDTTAYLKTVRFARQLERENIELLEAITRGDSLGNDLVFLLRYSADMLNRLVPIEGEGLPTVKDLNAAADRILKAIQTVKGKS